MQPDFINTCLYRAREEVFHRKIHELERKCFQPFGLHTTVVFYFGPRSLTQVQHKACTSYPITRVHVQVHCYSIEEVSLVLFQRPKAFSLQLVDFSMGRLLADTQDVSTVIDHILITCSMECQRMHDALKPLAWLEGTWRAERTGQGKFPTIKSFNFSEEVIFSSIGQPLLNYVGQSWHPETKKPMHREVGFLKIIPGTDKVSLIVAHNFGLTTIEEGQVDGIEMKLKSTSVTRMSEGCKDPVVLRIEREFRLVGSQLEQTLRMATTNVSEVTEHIRTIYQKIEK